MREATQGGHSLEGAERERERNTRTWGSAFIGVEGGMPRVLQVHALLANFKHESKS